MDARPTLLCIPEVARILRINTPRAYELARCGVLPSIRIGRSIRVDPDRFRAWLDAGGMATRHTAAEM